MREINFVGLNFYPAGVFDYYIKHTLLKDITLTYLDKNLKPITNSTIEKAGRVSTNVLGRESLSISTTSGIGPYGCSKGAFKTDVYSTYGSSIINPNLIKMTKGAVEYTLSELILMGIVGEYKQPRFQLSGTLDAKIYGLDIRRKLIKDSHHPMGEKAFYVVSGTYNDIEETVKVLLLELTDTKETI